MAKVELKQPVVDEIKAMLDGAVGAVVVDYRGLTVEQDTKLRKQLREAGVSYKVYKNTLIKRAAEGTEFAALDPHLEGPTALAVSKDDATAPARILAEFAKTAPKLELKASVVEGTYYDQAGTQVIATIPSREVLLGKLLGSIGLHAGVFAPLRAFAATAVAQLHVDAGAQLVQVEGFRQVVVGPFPEQHGLVSGGNASRDDDNRQIGIGGANTANDFLAGGARQHEVGDNHIGAAFSQKQEALGA